MSLDSVMLCILDHKRKIRFKFLNFWWKSPHLLLPEKSEDALFVSHYRFFAELIVKIFSSFCLALYKLPILCNIVFLFIVFGFGKAQLICRKIYFFKTLWLGNWNPISSFGYSLLNCWTWHYLNLLFGLYVYSFHSSCQKLNKDCWL